MQPVNPLRGLKDRDFSAFRMGNKENTSSPKDTYAYILRVHLVEGINLAIRDVWGASDPYCILTVGDQSAKSKIIKRNLNPKWDQAFIFNLPEKPAQSSDPNWTLKIECFDYDFGSKDDEMGIYEYDLTQLTCETAPKTEKLALKQTESGEIVVKFHLMPATAPAVKDPFRFATQAVKVARSAKKKIRAQQGFLTVAVIEASGLMVTDPNAVNAYVKLRLGGLHTTWRTKVVQPSVGPEKDISPRWNESFDLNLKNCEGTLEISVWDKCFGSDDFLGSLDVSFEELKQDNTHDLWLELNPSGGGKIHVLLTLTGFAVDNSPNSQNTDIVEVKKKPIGMLDVTVVKAENVLAMDFGGTSDPFAVLTLGNSMRRTDTIQSTLHPEWNKAFQFEITDVRGILEVEVFDQDPGDKRDFLGKVQIPLLNAPSGKHWFILKEKNMYQPSRGRIFLDISVKWDYFRAAKRVFQPPESGYLAKEPKFKRKVFLLNVERVKRVVFSVINVLDLQALFEWENTFDSALAFTVYIFASLYFELWMLPLVLVGGLVAGRFTRGGARAQKWLELHLQIDQEGSREKDEKKKKPTERKGLRDTLHEVEETLSKIQNQLGDVASTAERISNTVNWTVPFCSGLLLVCLFVGSIVMYFVPFRILILLAGVNKFTKKWRRKGPRVDNNELLNFLSCIPSHLQVIQYKNPEAE